MLTLATNLLANVNVNFTLYERGGQGMAVLVGHSVYHSVQTEIGQQLLDGLP